LATEHAQLQRDNRLLTKRLERAEAIIEIQKNELGSSGRLWRWKRLALCWAGGERPTIFWWT
jgi:hypothetical protein